MPEGRYPKEVHKECLRQLSSVELADRKKNNMAVFDTAI